jgi:hypothetical protein
LPVLLLRPAALMGTWQTDDGEVYDDDGVLIEVDGEDPE